MVFKTRTREGGEVQFEGSAVIRTDPEAIRILFWPDEHIWRVQRRDISGWFSVHAFTTVAALLDYVRPDPTAPTQAAALAALKRSD